MGTLFSAAAIGLAAGYLSGQFGVGGGIVTTPALRLILGVPELIAVGTPLPVIIPTAVSGAIGYLRRGMVDLKLGVTVGVLGGLFAIGGAWLTSLVGGTFVLIVTAAIIIYTAVDMTVLALRPARPDHVQFAEMGRIHRAPWVIGLAAVAGMYSGFLGLGGGVVVVPALVRFFSFPTKRAIGTSLVVVSLLAIPGTVTHYLLGNVDLALAAAMTVGVVPGALIGARVTARAQDKVIKLGFAAMLLAIGVLLAVTEMGAL